MIENFRAHPYTRAVCLETARLFEQRAAKHLVEAQDAADEGAVDSAREFQAKARLAQERASAWHVRRKTLLAKHRTCSLDEDDLVNAG